MASARKKQDDKHLKILREIVSIPANKECFDCHQKGPTYVNMTIGSFVCTSCSGLLRGLTPPHRVKSISMASFTPEEVDQIKARGNEYCKRIWLGLYDTNHIQDAKEEQQIKDFMIAKYERKRYYLDPTLNIKATYSNFSPPPTHSYNSTPTSASSVSEGVPEIKPLSNLLGLQAKSLSLNIQSSNSTSKLESSGENMFTPDKSPSEFTADPFSSSNQPAQSASQPFFANFDNNPIFNSASNHFFDNVINSENIPARFNTNRWSMPTVASLSSLGNPSSFSNMTKKCSSSANFPPPPLLNSNGVPSAQTEDRYAALKDLDSLMKSQHETQIGDWSSGSLGNTWSASSTSFSNTTQPSSSIFVGNSSGLQGSFQEQSTANTANPFTDSSVNPWPSNGIAVSGFNQNPFRKQTFGLDPAGNQIPEHGFGWSGMNGLANGQTVNGGSNVFHPSAFPTSQSMNFPSKTLPARPTGNPFVLGTSPSTAGGHSSNPFLF